MQCSANSVTEAVVESMVMSSGEGYIIIFNKQVIWHYNPPSAPHFEGVFQPFKNSTAVAVLGMDVNDVELQIVFKSELKLYWTPDY